MLERRGLSGVPERGSVVDGRAMARPLGMLFLGAGLLALLWIALPHTSDATPGAVGAVAGIGIAGGALLLSGKLDDRPASSFELALAFGNVLISVAVFFSGRAGSGFGFFYLWATPYAYWFFSYRRALYQMALAVAGYAGAAALVRAAHPDVPGNFGSDVSRILLAVGTIAIVGELVRLVSNRLRDSHMRFQEVMREAPIGMARLRVDGSFIQVNEAFCKLLDRSEHEIIGSTLLERVPEEDRPAFEERQHELLSGSVGSYQADTTYARPDGSRVSAILTATLIRDQAGRPREIFMQVLDVTARKQAEEGVRAFFALAENAGDFIGIAELDGRLRYVNEAGRTMIGAGDLDEVQALTIMDCLTGRGRELFVERENPALFERGSWRGETQLRNVKTGAELDVELNSFIIHDPDTGEPASIGIVQRDISDRKRAWLALERSHDERRRLLAGLVRAQEEERERIAADVHDDSIQVMTGAAIRIQLLADQLADPTQRQLLGRLDESVRTSIGSLRQLLFELRPPALDAHGLGAAIETYLSHTLEPEGMEYALRDELDEEPPSEVRTVLYRVAQEALSNVRKHSRASRVDVLIESSMGGWTVRVEDDGAGFEVEEAAVERPGHLGLIGMRERVETSGGRMSVVSSPGAGTTVEFWMPSAQHAFIEAS
jgi:PAS domain S-box-containing protein